MMMCTTKHNDQCALIRATNMYMTAIVYSIDYEQIYEVP